MISSVSLSLLNYHPCTVTFVISPLFTGIILNANIYRIIFSKYVGVGYIINKCTNLHEQIWSAHCHMPVAEIFMRQREKMSSISNKDLSQKKLSMEIQTMSSVTKMLTT